MQIAVGFALQSALRRRQLGVHVQWKRNGFEVTKVFRCTIFVPHVVLFNKLQTHPNRCGFFQGLEKKAL
ncbi:uncharacterized protein Dana_GF28148 [Drosophila ananassae]|uniref:Uncharacterized protein n=1 Tax=Drosophila ananassae TaxID=7217 RepID=A0A0P9BS83_DROAN|nr:uncharacterized protein Dana_GF28148 [Drosophila ananassae]